MKKLITASAALSAVLVIGYISMADNDSEAHNQTLAQQPEASVLSAPQTSPESNMPRSPSVPALANPMDANVEANVTPNESDWFSGALKLQLVDVAQAYEMNIQFPTYSKPLSQDDWNLLNPRAFIPTSIPLEGQDGISAAIVVEKYIVHDDEDLPVAVVISGLDSLSKVQGVSVSIGKENVASGTDATELEGSQAFYTRIVSKRALEGFNGKDVPVKAEIQFKSGDTSIVSAVIKVVATDATLTEVKDAYVDGPHLMIPVEFDVKVPGHYRFQANLFDEQSGEPISHISDTFKLSKLSNDAELKVHAVTLRAKGYEGPYLLAGINVTRAPAKPGDSTGYGASSEQSYQVNGFDLDRYSDEEYHNAENQRRLEFLRRMAGHTSP